MGIGRISIAEFGTRSGIAWILCSEIGLISSPELVTSRICFLGYDLRARVFSHWLFLPYRDTCDISSFLCLTPFSHEKPVCFQGERECGLKVILKGDSKGRKRHIESLPNTLFTESCRAQLSFTVWHFPAVITS